MNDIEAIELICKRVLQPITELVADRLKERIDELKEKVEEAKKTIEDLTFEKDRLNMNYSNLKLDAKEQNDKLLKKIGDLQYVNDELRRKYVLLRTDMEISYAENTRLEKTLKDVPVYKWQTGCPVKSGYYFIRTKIGSAYYRPYINYIQQEHLPIYDHIELQWSGPIIYPIEETV